MGYANVILRRIKDMRQARRIAGPDGMPTHRSSVKTLPANDRGRDFVVGDIHGAFALLQETLELVDFDESNDRLISVGDLIDRGPYSLSVQEYLDKPYFHAIRGNHEDFFCEVDIPNLRGLARIDYNGLQWISQLTDHQITALQERLAQLPTAMELPSAIGSVGFVHADVPKHMTWQAFTAAITAGCESTITVALSGRKRIEDSDTSGVLGVDRVFVGHTVCWDGPERLGNVFAVDTGATYAEADPNDRQRRPRGFMTIADVTADCALLTQTYREPSLPHSTANQPPRKVHALRIAYDQVQEASDHLTWPEFIEDDSNQLTCQ